jgi:hypothetical protein
LCKWSDLLLSCTVGFNLSMWRTTLIKISLVCYIVSTCRGNIVVWADCFSRFLPDFFFHIFL